MKHYNSREEVPTHEKWDLTDIYSSLSDWEKDYQHVLDMTEQLKKYDGNIQSGATLYDYLSRSENLSKTFNLVYVYAMLSGDLDTRDHHAQSLLDRAKHASVKVSAASSFFMPFLLSLEEEQLKKYIEEESRLDYFAEDLYDSFRYKPHVLSKEEEQIVSRLGEAMSSPSNTFGMINNADIIFGDVTDDDGGKVPLTRGMYAKRIEDEDRSVRQEAYKAYYKPYTEMKNTIASTLAAAIKNNVAMADIRHYPSALEKSLFADNVSLSVYENLIETTKANIEPMHRYNQIRKERLNVDELRQYDLSAPLVSGVKLEIPYDEAYETMLLALRPLGDDYQETLRSFKDKRYIDVRETPGKRSGAYNLGVHGVHPFVLLNHQDDLDSLFTLAHEMGHAMHSYYSNKHQPRISAGYSIFVAEVASTVNEVLLIHYLLEKETDPTIKKHLVNHFIDQFKGTLFTQVMFAEFEKRTHELAQKGQPLNAEVFNSVYEELFQEFQGDTLVFDPEVKFGWSRIPHFYRPFYVYKYATGYISAIHIATRLLAGDQETLKTYLTFLKSGSSDYPIELLKKTGVDLTSEEPIKSAMKKFSELVEEFSKL
ncbi:oligoendopeptidase F [Fictibacillus macauensis ZFHKF-1]|uniref:Oligopeptidase F n=1 Tax=Fictibacillus macauensis ZFHKF-1 TaxID=1196324 RepID=I8AKX3_9BACL|nr:oligoendopeptidase F [Fictibacillus macauensis]EIT86482.1 oligoendopeptidase F [Fictibacillus macauensis ZFHKF-1]